MDLIELVGMMTLGKNKATIEIKQHISFFFKKKKKNTVIVNVDYQDSLTY